MTKLLDNINIENAKIIFRNFKGEGNKYNRQGAKNFCVIIDDSDKAKELLSNGWNIRQLPAHDEDSDEVYYLQVSVSFDNIPPKVLLITGKNKTLLDADTIDTLDFADIKNVDLIIRPYNWEITGKDGTKCGVKAYLKTMYVTIFEDEFAEKYVGLDGPNEQIPF